MCEDVELDINDEMLEMLKAVSAQEIVSVVNDECSMSIITECEPETYEELAMALGKTLLNSIIVDTIKVGIELTKEKTDET